MAKQPRNLTVKQVARILGVSGSAVLLYRTQGRLKATGREERRVGKTKRRQVVLVFDPKVVEAFAKDFTKSSHNVHHGPRQKRIVESTPEPTEYKMPESTSNIIELVDNAIAALQLIREEALKLQTTRSDFKKRFLELIGG